MVMCSSFSKAAWLWLRAIEEEVSLYRRGFEGRKYSANSKSKEQVSTLHLFATRQLNSVFIFPSLGFLVAL
jgi:hypothetical protein